MIKPLSKKKSNKSKIKKKKPNNKIIAAKKKVIKITSVKDIRENFEQIYKRLIDSRSLSLGLHTALLMYKDMSPYKAYEDAKMLLWLMEKRIKEKEEDFK
jgi:ADP-dependent phosphofructokinase/glucokinase